MPLITNERYLVLLFVTIVSTSIWIEKKTLLGRKIGSAFLVIIFGFFLSNFSIIPNESKVYSFILNEFTLLSMIFFIIGADLRYFKLIGIDMIKAINLAFLSTMVGAFLATYFFYPLFQKETWKLTGVITATYTGGTVNFIILAQQLNLDSKIYLPALASDSLVTAMWVIFSLFAPKFTGFLSQNRTSMVSLQNEKLEETIFLKTKLSILHLFIIILISLFVFFLSLILSDYMGGYLFLWVTILSLVVAQLPFVRGLQGAFVLGGTGLLFTLMTIGISANLKVFLNFGYSMFLMTLLTVLIHGVILFTTSIFFRINFPTVLIASQCAIGGSSTALAVVASKKWSKLTAPALIAGALGAAIGNLLGLINGNIMKFFITI